MLVLLTLLFLELVLLLLCLLSAGPVLSWVFSSLVLRRSRVCCASCFVGDKLVVVVVVVAVEVVVVERKEGRGRTIMKRASSATQEVEGRQKATNNGALGGSGGCWLLLQSRFIRSSHRMVRTAQCLSVSPCLPSKACHLTSDPAPAPPVPQPRPCPLGIVVVTLTFRLALSSKCHTFPEPHNHPNLSF
ncbi:hypothetical protein E2C01_040500 [Portunus trituberculatus]|uniref:Uncharacterized protein n=1 Tax=Portunus trituberculatus TaxID=210409 RepID=A0A5B7FQY8_PORTR|nr:hypothetical protein [Portunus trituberculatus]